MSRQGPRAPQNADDVKQWTVDTTVATLRRLRAGVVYISATGPAFVPEMAEAMEREIADQGSLIAFVNLLEVARLDGEARERWTAWSKRIRGQCKAHFLVRSKLVEMALSLIALISGIDLRSYTDVARFEAAMREAAPNANLPEIKRVA